MVGKVTCKDTDKEGIKGSILNPSPLIPHFFMKALPSRAQPPVHDVQIASGRQVDQPSTRLRDVQQEELVTSNWPLLLQQGLSFQAVSRMDGPHGSMALSQFSRLQPYDLLPISLLHQGSFIWRKLVETSSLPWLGCR